MKPKLLLTLDVEALPARAKQHHIQRLIYGKFGNESFGIDRIFDIAEKYGIQLTCFFDYGEYPRYGETCLDVARHIYQRNQDLQLHLHPDFLGDKFWKDAGFEPARDLRTFNREQAEAAISFITDLHKKVTGTDPIAFRGGAYKLGPAILEALAKNGIRYDSTYNPGRSCLDFNIGNQPPFNWECGVTELPIPYLVNFLGYPKAFEFNFNNYYFQKYSDHERVDKMLDFLATFKSSFPTALPVLVMHSWSFLNLNKATGHYESINHQAADAFEEFCERVQEKYEPITCAILAEQGFKGEFETDYKATMLSLPELNGKKTGKCNICGTGQYLESFNSSNKRYCKNCKSLERQRTLAKLLEFDQAGIDLHGREVLHLGGAFCEKELLMKSGANSRILDVRPDTGADIIADICAMPKVPAKSFDYILCCQILPHVHDLQSALGELARVLKDDGVMLQCNVTKTDMATQETGDPEEIAKWYGQENYEKYRVGSFRYFGEIGLEDLFKPWFERVRYEITDDSTGHKIYWNLWRKRGSGDSKDSSGQDSQEDKPDSVIKCERIPAEKIYLIADKSVEPNRDTILFRPAGRTDLPEYEINFPFDWNGDPFHDANWQAQLNMWRFLDAYILKYEATKDTTWLARLVEAIQDWHRYYRANAPGKYVWKDMLTGMRAMKLAWILAAYYSEEVKFGPYFIKICEQLRDEHLKFLLNEKKIAYSNHTYMDLHGAIALAKVSPEGEASKISEFVREKFAILLGKQFDPDGVHCENSPQYQAFGLSRLKNLLRTGWFDDYGLKEMAAKASNILSLMYQPDGKMVPVGDTDGNIASDRDFYESVSAPEMASHGGYVIVRARTPRRASHLFFMGAFNAQLHKHSDDLSLTWYENCPILCDGGKYAYGKSPEREYFISTRAHNTLEIDNTNTHEFVEADQFIPYGSKIKLTFSAHDCFGMVGEMNIVKFDVLHRRSLLYRPGAFLIVADSIKGSEAHSYNLHWHLAPDIKDIVTDGDSYRAQLPTGENLHSGWLATRTMGKKWLSGEREPRLHGFISKSYKQMTPDHTLRLSATAKKLDIVTVFSLDCEMEFSFRKKRFVEFAWAGKNYVFDLKEASLSMRDNKNRWHKFLDKFSGTKPITFSGNKEDEGS